MDIPSISMESVRAGLRSRQFSAQELAAEALRFAEAENPSTNAYLHFSPERAMETARRVDGQIARVMQPSVVMRVRTCVEIEKVLGVSAEFADGKQRRVRLKHVAEYDEQGNAEVNK